MLDEVWDKVKIVHVLFITCLFYILWIAFFNYRPYFSHLDSFVSAFSLYDIQGAFEPVKLKTIAIFGDFVIDKKSINSFILFFHLFNSLLFFNFFDKKNKLPIASCLYVLSPFVFYNLSIQDFGHVALETFGICYVFISFSTTSFKNKNILILMLLLFGTLIDYSFLLIFTLDFFYLEERKSFYFRALVVAVFAISLGFYDNRGQLDLLSRAEIIYQQRNISYPQYFLFFINSFTEFAGGMLSLGISFIETKVHVRDIFFKLLFLISSIYLILRFYRNKIVTILAVFFSIFIFTKFFKSSSLVMALGGVYYNSIAINASVFFPVFLGVCYLVSKKENKELVVFCFVLGIVAWINLLNNSSNNIINVYRNDAPVFWGLEKHKDLNFNKNFQEIYPQEVKKLSTVEKMFSAGLKNINSKDYEHYVTLRSQPFSVLDVFVYMNKGQFIKSQETLGVLYINNIISKAAYNNLGETINYNFEIKLSETIHPLIFELLTKQETSGVAESVYLLGLLQYSNLRDDVMKGALTHEFGATFKPKK